MSSDRQWTIYLAQDKHLDYNWCGTNTEIEVRMAAVLDGHLALAERAGVRWNLDCTLWAEVYRRHRGEAGFDRLMDAIRGAAAGASSCDTGPRGVLRRRAGPHHACFLPGAARYLAWFKAGS